MSHYCALLSGCTDLLKVALLEKVDYSALGQYIDVGRRRGILVRPLLLSGEGGILAVSYLCNPEDGPATGSTNDE